jgi:hypothetical protein
MQNFREGDLVNIRLKSNGAVLYSGLVIAAIAAIYDHSKDPGIYKILVFDSYRKNQYEESEVTRWFDFKNNRSFSIDLIQRLEKSNVTE